MRQALNRCSTARVGVSTVALTALFGGDAQDASNTHILYCGIELDRFLGPPLALREELGVGLDARLFVHVGRFVEAKNHTGLIALFSQYARRDSKAHLVLVGDGPLRLSIDNCARESGVSKRIHFLGIRPDVAAILRACDCFLFPSLWEGLPLALLEAQAAGLPALVSTNVTDEADVIVDLIGRFRLEDSPSVVCRQIDDYIPKRMDVADSVAHLRNSRFSVESSARALQMLYEGLTRAIA